MAGMYNDIAWLPLCLTLSILGGVGAFLAFRHGRRMAAARWLAAALLPMGLYLIGAVRLVWDIGYELTRFVTRFAFSPTVWLGVILLASSAGLFATTAVLARRLGPGPRGKGGPPAVTAGRGGAKRSAAASGGDFDDIEEILRRRGIK